MAATEPACKTCGDCEDWVSFEPNGWKANGVWIGRCDYSGNINQVCVWPYEDNGACPRFKPKGPAKPPDVAEVIMLHVVDQFLPNMGKAGHTKLRDLIQRVIDAQETGT